MKKSLLNSFILASAIGLGSQVLAERNPTLPPPNPGGSTAKEAVVIGWPAGKTPTAAAGFAVSEFVSLDAPRALYKLPSGNILVSQAEKHPDDNGEHSPNKITLLVIKNGQLTSQKEVLTGLHLPFGMAVWQNQLFVAEPERVLVYPFVDETVTGPGTVIATLPFPMPKRHWTRNLLISKDGSKLYVSVGSASNVGEDGDPLDPRTAAILEMNLDGSQQRIYASGLRNPVQLAWEPETEKLWAVVNERDEIGDNLPPDYMTAVKENGFYGWPYAYWGPHEDPRLAGQRPDLVAKSIVPDFALGAHTASLGITFTKDSGIGADFDEGALIAQHGSWNSSTFVGYRVWYVGFQNGLATDQEKAFLTGFVADEANNTVYGRPVNTVILEDGSVLVSDDGGDKIWLVKKTQR